MIPASSRRLLLRVRREGAQAPDLLREEVVGVIARRSGGRRLSERRAQWFAAFFDGLAIAYDTEGAASDYAAARALAGETGLTVKDAAYVELALRTRAHLATRDRAMRDAARRIGVEVV